MARCTCWFAFLRSAMDCFFFVVPKCQHKQKKERITVATNKHENHEHMFLSHTRPMPAESVEPIYNVVDARDTSLFQSMAVYHFRHTLEVCTYITVISSFVYSLSPSQTHSHSFSACRRNPPNIIFYYELLASNEHHYNTRSRRRAHSGSYVSWRIRIRSISSHDVISKPKEHHQHRIM